MPLFIESIDNIAQAIVTVKRALKAGVIEEENYKDFNEYLTKQKKLYGVNKTHIADANRELDAELEEAENELFIDKNDELYKMAEELLAEHEKDEVKVDLQREARDALLMMSAEERQAMIAVASKWQ
jgi:hypothetical protein